jgi:hypothetical protein
MSRIFRPEEYLPTTGTQISAPEDKMNTRNGKNKRTKIS